MRTLLKLCIQYYQALFRLILLVGCALAGCTIAAQAKNDIPAVLSVEAPPIQIAIIIDDLGSNWPQARRVLRLPKAVATSILPFTPHATKIARLSKNAGHPVLIHIPMEADKDNELLGPGALTEGMGFWALIKQLRRDIVSIPGAEGVNNHMGSKLTRETRKMRWVMAMLRWQNLYFIDSRTSTTTVALSVAKKMGVSATSRDVFLDHRIDETAINQQFDRLIAIAHKQGYALAIGHPYQQTLNVLEKRLPLLKRLGIELVPVNRLLDWPSLAKKPVHLTTMGQL